MISKKILALILLTSILLVACQKTTTTVKTDQGDVTVETTAGVDDWCQVGAKWSSTSAEATAEMIIQGIETSGKYAGYCHVTYESTSETGQADVDLYFDEEGNGYQVMVINGQTFESEWTS